MAEIAEIGVAGRVGGVTADHPANLAALDELVADLKSVPALRTTERDRIDHGSKGGWTELFVGLGGAGGIAAFVQIVRLWLGRDRHRTLTISVTEQPDGKVIEIKGENISVDTLTEALGAANPPAAGELDA